MEENPNHGDEYRHDQTLEEFEIECGIDQVPPLPLRLPPTIRNDLYG